VKDHGRIRKSSIHGSKDLLPGLVVDVRVSVVQSTIIRRVEVLNLAGVVVERYGRLERWGSLTRCQAGPCRSSGDGVASGIDHGVAATRAFLCRR
jgi:hypothetical protein